MKILIVTKNWIGDILFEIPAIEMIHKRYPEAEILCLTHSRCREILELHPDIHRVIAFDERESSWREKFQLMRQLRQEKIETAYLFHRSRTRAFLLMLAGIKNRIGYGVKSWNFLTRAVPEPKKQLHHVDYFTSLLEQTGFQKNENACYSFYFSKKDLENVEKMIEQHALKNFVCFHLGANWEPKRWPEGHFAQLAKLLSEKWNFTVVLTGGIGDENLSREVLRNSDGAKILSLVGKTRLGELAALFTRAAFVISGDSGPMHIASGAGARVLALFGPTDPQLTGPRGLGEKIVLSFVPQGYQVPFYGKNFPEQGWLSNISPAEVITALESRGWGGTENLRPQLPLSPSPEKEKEPPLLPREKSGKKILLNTLSNIGDVILTTPVIMALAKQFPNHPLTVIVSPRAKGILEGSAFIHRIVIYDKHASLREKINFLKELRRDEYEAVVDLKNSAIPFLVSAKKRSPLVRILKKTSAREKHLEILEKMGLATENIPTFDFYNRKEEISTSIRLKAKGNVTPGWIVVAPVAASEIKTWPLASYQKIIENLLDQTPYTIVLVGGPREVSLVQPLVALSPFRVLNMAGETTLRELAAIIAKSELLLANDSSAAQLGFAMNHPTAVIFGPTDPKKFGREGNRFRILFEKLPCVPCEQSTCRFEKQACLLDLSPEKVLGACLELLAQNRVKMAYSQGQNS